MMRRNHRESRGVGSELEDQRGVSEVAEESTGSVGLENQPSLPWEWSRLVLE